MFIQCCFKNKSVISICFTQTTVEKLFRPLLLKNARLWSTSVIENQIANKTKQIKKNINSKEVALYIESNENIKLYKHLIPNSLLIHKRKPPDALYLVDNIVAIKFYNAIEKYLTKTTSEVIEVNPGLGLLTNHLLRSKIKKIHVFEQSMHFSSVWTIKNDIIKFINKDFLSIPKLMFQDRFDNVNRTGNLLADITPKQWSNDPSMLIIGVLPNIDFIKYLMYSIIFQSGINTYGRTELLVAVTPQVLILLTSSNEVNSYLVYRATSVLFQILFDYEILDTLPRSSFLPWVTEKKSSRSKHLFKLHNADQSVMYILRIVPKKHLPVENQYLQPLWYFVKHHMVSRKNKVIPQLERWIPGCGAKLILLNGRLNKSKSMHKSINIFTEFGELSPIQILALFKQFVNFPEYSECPFIASMESSLLKLETTDDTTEVDDTEVEEIMDEIVISDSKTEKSV